MPRTADHLVTTHKSAAARRAGGLKIWDEILSVPVHGRDDLTFEQKRDTLVAGLKTSRWVRNSYEHAEIRNLVEELADTEFAEAYDTVLDCIYDEADIDRVWLKLR